MREIQSLIFAKFEFDADRKNRLITSLPETPGLRAQPDEVRCALAVDGVRIITFTCVCVCRVRVLFA
jgi:hypothetical protein